MGLSSILPKKTKEETKQQNNSCARHGHRASRPWGGMFAVPPEWETSEAVYHLATSVPSWSCTSTSPETIDDGKEAIERTRPFAGRRVMTKKLMDLYRKEEGAVGYILLWAMGVPASLLFVIFLLRGCN
jgi:hypothetical protein